MQFNPSKCNIICISNKQRPPQRQYFFCGSKLEQVDSASYLGITVNSKLKWSEHISSISSKASQSLGLIKRNLWNCPRKVRETAYTSIVRPKLEYASASWDPHYKKDISTLERVQRKAARFCLQNFSRTALSLVAADKTTKWFESHLTDRTQVVRIGTSTSTPLPITHGAPQGAILSPLLFCIYISDLPLAPQVCNLESYVDDSKIFLSFPVKDAESAERVLEEDLRRVAAWCCKNQLLINPEKTKFLMVGTQQLLRRLPNEISISFLGKEITPVSSAKDLGIILDNNLTYDQHIHQLTSSCMTKLCQINRVKNSFERDTLCTIISPLALSKLFYCSTVWSSTTATNIKKLQAVQ